MKFGFKNGCLLFLAINQLFLSSEATELESTYYHDVGFKKIIFFSILGGSSHYNWVLSICEELGVRGHNATFLTSDTVAKYGKPFKHVNTVTILPGLQYDPKDFATSEIIRNTRSGKFFATALKYAALDYEEGYMAIRHYLVENNIDLALCDQFGTPCVDAAVSVGIPYIVTSTDILTKDGSAPYLNFDLATGNQPTTEFESLPERFYNTYVRPALFLRDVLPELNHLVKRKKAIGLDAKLEEPSETWKNAIKLVNNAFGFIPARPLGPLVHLVGPIMQKQVAPLTDTFKTYLDEHRRVVYVAFGQTATPSSGDATNILVSLFESMERNYIDGFIWATVNDGHMFPSTIKTSSGTVYRTQDMFDQVHPHARAVPWAPQMAILLHPSVCLFLSHAGMGSLHESVFAGTPMLLFPFFADQPRNANFMEQNKLGITFEYNSPPLEIAEKIHQIVEDKEGEFRDKMRRMQSFAQIRSKHGVIRGADIVEEVAYTHKNGILEHRVSADHRMSFIKAHNLDLYAFLAFVVVSLLSVVGFTAYKVFSLSQAYFKKSKLKSQ